MVGRTTFFFFLLIGLLTNDYVYSQKYWQCCNCASMYELNPTGAGTNLTIIKVCDKCRNSRCAMITTAQDPISNMIDLNFHTPTADEWKKLLAENKAALIRHLENLRRSFCDDKATQAAIDEMLNSLNTLNPESSYSEGQLLQERLKIARIDLGLKELGNKECKSIGNQKDKITCPPGSSTKDATAEDALKEYLTDKLKEAGEVITEDTKLGDRMEKLSKGQKYWGYWKQIMAATCISPELMQALQQYIRAKKIPGEDLSDECTTLCAKSADWYAELTGDPRLKREFMIACWNQCR
jgi:hypothetical protein